MFDVIQLGGRGVMNNLVWGGGVAINSIRRGSRYFDWGRGLRGSIQSGGVGKIEKIKDFRSPD